MKPIVKKVLMGVGGVVLVGALGGGVWAWTQVSAFSASMDKVYDVPVPKLKVVATPELIARGKHLASSLAGCGMRDCHGPALAGGKTMDVGPLGKFTAPNITSAGLGAVYSDGELARLIGHGITKTGKSVRFMPSHEVNWLPDSDVQAIIAYVRSKPAVEKPNGLFELGLLAKILDRQDAVVVDVARRIDHDKKEDVPAPEPTAAYGKFIARLCMGCHGEHYGGGPIPGAPSDFPIPSNITPDETGLKSWTYADFTKMLDTGVRKNGKKLDPFMPLEALEQMNDIERKALWAFLKTLKPRPMGSR
ncbi:MAG: c-type cytochrome [Myxococcales bacterium]|nr:c-type cytochrome [Myxococcales bacterium]